MKNKKIALVGTHGVGKSKICEKVLQTLAIQKARIKYTPNAWRSDYLENVIQSINSQRIKPIHLAQISDNLAFIPEQFREILNDLFNQSGKMVKQTEEITLATYAKQLYLENLYTAQGKNVLCDRSVLDTFVYLRYFKDQIKTDEIDLSYFSWQEMGMFNIDYCEWSAKYQIRNTYSKIYLIEPSDRLIEDDGFRMMDKKQQLEIHQLFLEYFKEFNNIEIINQEDAHKEEFVERIANYFI
jgi:thymidylate kinase